MKHDAWHFRKVAFAWVLVVAILGGCSSQNGSGNTPDKGKILTMADGTIVMVGPPTSNGMSALLKGHVEVIGPGHCLGVRGEGGDAEVVLWPNGTRVTDNGRSAVIIGGKRFALGETIELGGGSVPAAVIKTLTVPEECRADEVFVAGPQP